MADMRRVLEETPRAAHPSRPIRVTAKKDLGFSPKRWQEREIPLHAELAKLLECHPRRENCQFVFPSPRGNREQNMLLKCKAVAERCRLDPAKFDLRTFRSTYATRMLRFGFDVRTVQRWMGHKFAPQGLRNRDLQSLLYPAAARTKREQRRRSAAA